MWGRENETPNVRICARVEPSPRICTCVLCWTHFRGIIEVGRSYRPAPGNSVVESWSNPRTMLDSELKF